MVAAIPVKKVIQVVCDTLYTGNYFKLLKNCSKKHKSMLFFIHKIDMSVAADMSEV